MEKKKIVFLYTEIATYFLACVEALIKMRAVEVHIVRFDVNKEAPFVFNFPDTLFVYERTNYNDAQLLQLVNALSPDMIVCSGWIDKGYLNVCRHYRNKIATVLTLDNHWKGNLKQHLACILAPFYLHRRFTHCWVPGDLQYTYAKHLGFKDPFILTGFYSCDFNYFNGLYERNKQEKSQNFPKRFIFVGRYVEAKGIRNLWEAFIRLQTEAPNEWELWCLGTGAITPVLHPKIKHFGFVQPAQFPEYIRQCGVFVLPSSFEPWGVAVHEFAAAGFPIICSTAVGANTSFVEDKINGYIYPPQESGALEKALKRMMNQNADDLIAMGEKSVSKAKQITPELWAKTIISLL
jgi:glycosyltransferase involved in cell wall biosynthesis